MQRALGLLVLLVAGLAALPLAALPFDGDGDESWIAPLAFGGIVVVGALVGLALPGLTGAGTPLRRALLGALIGIAMTVVGLVVFFLLLNGFDGA